MDIKRIDVCPLRGQIGGGGGFGTRSFGVLFTKKSSFFKPFDEQVEFFLRKRRIPSY